jgi:ElaB/YqjD/DUF883 family membrane-anchored ribosome-binding protein
MATADTFADKDAKQQIAELRGQVEQLMNDRVTPALAGAAQRVETTARNAAEVARGQAEAVSGQVREQPLVSILIAVGVGYLIGRFVSP